MAVYSLLYEKKDLRKDSEDCDFNGFLEDYVGQDQVTVDPVIKEAFGMIMEKYPDVKICAGLKEPVSKEAISNQIIRYKDIFKLQGKPVVLPYMLYAKNGDEERAMMVVPYSEYSFIYAKGLYYCITEPGSEMIDCKNEIVAVTSDQPQVIADAFTSMFKQKCGALQRNLDSRYFRNYDELKEKVYAAAEELKAEAQTEMPGIVERNPKIYTYIIRWFLMKKVLYVQYMVNKNILNSVHEGNVRKQRNQAKVNADAIKFLSYSEMWRIPSES